MARFQEVRLPSLLSESSTSASEAFGPQKPLDAREAKISEEVGIDMDRARQSSPWYPPFPASGHRGPGGSGPPPDVE